MVKIDVLVFGAGVCGQITKKILEVDGYRVVGFIDDEPTLHGNFYDNVMVYSRRDALTLDCSFVVVAIQNISDNQRSNIESWITSDLKLKHFWVPPYRNWYKGTFNSRDLFLDYEKILNRDAILIDLNDAYRGRNVIVTGAAGSIGSELVRMLVKSGAARIECLDINESDLHDLEKELEDHDSEIVTYLCDISNYEELEYLFDKLKGDIVINAAAYKHVYAMQKQPYLAFKVNVLGLVNLLKLSKIKGIDRFIQVSTDKAINPTGFMGLSKLVAEEVTSLYRDSFDIAVTRFGNVLGSRGSVIPLFLNQIKNGGPVTVTDKNVTRYFMTIPEAASLVLQAGSIVQKHQLFVFDMGSPVKIYDLAKRLIEENPFNLNNVEIVITGLKSGEKKYEEPLSEIELDISEKRGKLFTVRINYSENNQIEKKIEYSKLIVEKMMSSEEISFNKLAL